jgi:hypothetical protein
MVHLLSLYVHLHCTFFHNINSFTSYIYLHCTVHSYTVHIYCIFTNTAPYILTLYIFTVFSRTLHRTFTYTVHMFTVNSRTLYRTFTYTVHMFTVYSRTLHRTFTYTVHPHTAHLHSMLVLSVSPGPRAHPQCSLGTTFLFHL